MNRCENCNTIHNGSYGSGRFCSSKCARGFSTKAKRLEINKKVSNKLRKSKPKLKLHCENCNTTFTSNYHKKTCSKKCADNLQKGRPKIGNYSNNGGFREGGGRCKSIGYTNHLGSFMKLNNEEILVAKILDKLKLNWNRNWNYFEYEELHTNKVKKFYPDFYVKDIDLYIEYKGWLTEKMRHKMKSSLSNNNFNLLIVVGHDKRYLDDGLNIDNLEMYIRDTVKATACSPKA